MKTEVYYFSGTGNSLIVARDIAKAVEGELIAIPSVIGQERIQTEADVIGIVFPVYMWGMPLIVERFIKKIDNLTDKYIFAIANYGGMPGGVINILDKVIQQCGGKLAAGFTVRMPGNYTPMYGAIPIEKQQKMFEQWTQKVKTIAEYIQSSSYGKKENSNGVLNSIGSFFNKISAKHIPEMDKKFQTDEKCSGCGICQKVCPVGNIALVEGKPSWQGRCEQCFACLQWCPETAIQCGKVTAKRKRYHHPEVQVSEIMKQARK